MVLEIFVMKRRNLLPVAVILLKEYRPIQIACDLTLDSKTIC